MGKLTKMPRAEQWAQKIKSQQAKSVESIVEVGRLLIQAKSDLPFGEWGRLFSEELITFSQNTADRLMAVARNPLLSNSAHGQNLPSSWRTLYELSAIEDQTVVANALRDGVITPDFQRKDVKALLPPKVKDEPEEDIHWIDALATLRVSIEKRIAEWPLEIRAMVPKSLRDLADILDAELQHVDRGQGEEEADAGDGVAGPHFDAVLEAEGG